MSKKMTTADKMAYFRMAGEAKKAKAIGDNSMYGENLPEAQKGFEPYLSEDKSIYYTSPKSGAYRGRGWRNAKQAERVLNRRLKRRMRKSDGSEGMVFDLNE